jgi:hypothetical protein
VERDDVAMSTLLQLVLIILNTESALVLAVAVLAVAREHTSDTATERRSAKHGLFVDGGVSRKGDSEKLGQENMVT